MPYIILVSAIHGKKLKSKKETINFQYQLQPGMLNTSCLIDHVLNSRLFWLCHQKNENLTNNSPIQIYFNRIKNIIIFIMKPGYYLDLLTPEAKKLLGKESTEAKITKDKNGENLLHSEIPEVTLISCNLVNNSYQ